MIAIRNLVIVKVRSKPIVNPILRLMMYSNTNGNILKGSFNAVTPKRVRANPAVMVLDTPEFHSIFTDELKQLITLFEKHKYELRIAGGAVRDLLLGKSPKDIDFATTATPDEMKKMFEIESIRMINTKGEKHGTITPRINNKENFEVTTLRVDVVTDGRHAEVQFTTDWQLDANRRDLTINSMYLGFDGTLYDYFYGYDDLQNKRVLFVGDAATRIQEDYLRILRYFRFYGRIAASPDNHDKMTLNAIRENVEGLNRISGERIWSEMQKIVSGNFAEELMLKMIDCDVTKFSGLPPEPNVEEFRRLCSTLKQFKDPYSPILLIISLLCNVEDAIKMHERLKLSAFERDLAFFITQRRDKVDMEYVTLLDYQKLCLEPNVKREFVLELLKYKGKIDLYEELKLWEIPKFPLNGNILKEHGCPPGKQMGYVYNQLKLIWCDSNFQISIEDLLEKHLPGIITLLDSSRPSSNKKIKLNK